MTSKQQNITSRGILFAGGGFEFGRERDVSAISVRYGIRYEGDRVGHATLLERTDKPEIGFDIYVSRQGHNIGMRALGGLSASLGQEGFELVTAGIRAGEARNYWKYQAAKGLVIPVDPTKPQTTNYRVLPNGRSVIKGLLDSPS